MRKLFRLGATIVLSQLALALAAPLTPAFAQHVDYEDYEEYYDFDTDSGVDTTTVILIGAGTFVLGGVVGYFIGEDAGVKKTERKYRDLINELPVDAQGQMTPQVIAPSEDYQHPSKTHSPASEVSGQSAQPQVQVDTTKCIQNEAGQILCPILMPAQ